MHKHATAKTLGIENAAGTAGAAVNGRNAGAVAWTGLPDAYKFSLYTPTFGYAWSNVGSYLNNAAIQSPTFTAPATTGPYVYTVTATSNVGCTATATATVTVASTTLGVSVGASPNPICLGSQTTLTATLRAVVHPIPMHGQTLQTMPFREAPFL